MSPSGVMSWDWHFATASLAVCNKGNLPTIADSKNIISHLVRFVNIQLWRKWTIFFVKIVPWKKSAQKRGVFWLFLHRQKCRTKKWEAFKEQIKKYWEKNEKGLDKRGKVWYNTRVKQSRALRSHLGTLGDPGLYGSHLDARGLPCGDFVFVRIFCLEVLSY